VTSGTAWETLQTGGGGGASPRPNVESFTALCAFSASFYFICASEDYKINLYIFFSMKFQLLSSLFIRPCVFFEILGCFLIFCKCVKKCCLFFPNTCI
jgi:hypothetical protein